MISDIHRENICFYNGTSKPNTKEDIYGYNGKSSETCRQDE